MLPPVLSEVETTGSMKRVLVKVAKLPAKELKSS